MPKKMLREVKGKLTLLTPLVIDKAQVRCENTISTEEAVQLIKQKMVRPRMFSPVCKVYFTGDLCKLSMEIRKILEYIDETNRIVADAIVEYIVDGTPADRLCTSREIKLSVFKNACSIVETFVCLPLLKRKRSVKQYRGYIYKPLDKVRIVFDLKKDYELMHRCLERGETEEMMSKRMNEEKRLNSVHVIQGIKLLDTNAPTASASLLYPQLRRQKTISTREAIELIQAECYMPRQQSPITKLHFTGTRSQLMGHVATIVRYTSRAGIGELSDAILEHIVNERPLKMIVNRMRISPQPLIDALWNVLFFVHDIVPLETELERAVQLPLRHSTSFSAVLYVQTDGYRIVNNLREDYLRYMRGMEENMDVKPELQRYEANRKPIFFLVDDDISIRARNKVGERLSKKRLNSILLAHLHDGDEVDDSMSDSEGGSCMNHPVITEPNPANINRFLFPICKSPVAERCAQVKISLPQPKTIPLSTKLHAKSSIEMIRDSLLRKPPQRNLTENEVNLIQRGTNISDELAAANKQSKIEPSPSVSAAVKPMYKLIREPGKPARLEMRFVPAATRRSATTFSRNSPEALPLPALNQVPKTEEWPYDVESEDVKPPKPIQSVECVPVPLPVAPMRDPKVEEPLLNDVEPMSVMPPKRRRISNNKRAGSSYIFPPPDEDSDFGL